MTPIPAGWKPISSAPKDGTTVILGRDMGAFDFIRGYGYFAGTEGAFVSGWVSKGFCEPHGNLGLANPTHWMPLPAAPGAETPEEPITVALDPDPRGVSVGVWQGSHCIYTGAHAVPASVAPGDAQDERQAFEAWFTRNDETKDMADRAVRRDACGEYYLMQTYTAWEIWRAARASVAAPAAGDALDAARWRFVRRKLFLTGNGDGTCGMHAINLPASIPGWPEPGAAVAEFCDAAIDAAIAAQQGKGGEA